jgi:hypothetical protein
MTVEVRVPEKWENHTIHTFVSPARVDDFAPNLTFSAYDTEERVSLEQVVQQLPLGEEFDDLLVLDRGYKTRGVARYHERTYRFVEPMQGLLLQQRQRFVMIKKRPYVFTLTSDVDGFDTHASALDEVFGRMLDDAVNAQG